MFAALQSFKFSAGVLYGMEKRALQKMLVGTVEGQPKLIVKVAEYHSVASVIHEKGSALGEFARNICIVGNGDPFGVATLGETGPKAEQSAVGAAPHKGTVRYTAGDAAGVMHGFAPWCLGGAEEKKRLIDRLFEIFAQLHGAYFPVTCLYPFVAEYHIRSAVGRKIKCAVKTLPLGRGYATVGMGRKRSERGGGTENSGAAAYAVVFETGEHIKTAFMEINLRCPVIAGSPETAVIAETYLWFAPVFHIFTDVYIKTVSGAPAGGASGAVKVVFAVKSKNEGVSYVDFGKFHENHLLHCILTRINLFAKTEACIIMI